MSKEVTESLNRRCVLLYRQVMQRQYAEADKGMMELLFENDTAKGLERRRGIRNRIPQVLAISD